MARNPLYDHKRSLEERVQWCISQLTLEEKLSMLNTRFPEIERLGIASTTLGGECAHGVQARHDQSFDLGIPVETASYSQPIGFSNTWDTELMYQIGEMVGLEQRAHYNDKTHEYLSVWAPTVDLERDPRWGRNEEGYGEDPFLTGEIAGNYISGMAGKHPFYKLTAATLKHFYANNKEEGRGRISSDMSEKLKQEYYLEPFRRSIEHGAEGVMTAYNAVNGMPGMISPEIQTVLKDRFGLGGHVVCDGGATVQIVDYHHYFDTHAKTIAAALKAGLDSFTDGPDFINPAVREAYENGDITEADLDRAIAATLRTRIRLGLFEEEGNNPYAEVVFTEADKKQATVLARKCAAESIVLLKNGDQNHKGLLPLKLKAGDKLAVFGNHAKRWYMDWYGSMPYERVTILDGIRTLGTQYEVMADEGCDRVLIEQNGQFLKVDAAGHATFTETKEHAEVFEVIYFENGMINIRSANGKLVRVMDDGSLETVAEEAFAWFVKETIFAEKQADGTYAISNWQKKPLMTVRVHMMSSGLERAKELAGWADYCIVTAGTHPLVSAKEDRDRENTALAEHDHALLETVYTSNDNTIMALLANFPYDIDREQKCIPSILMMSTGNMELGYGFFDVLTGRMSAAGRLSQTWYGEEFVLPDLNDYDIKSNGMTYQYCKKDVLYPFGYGLTYSFMNYRQLAIEQSDQMLYINFEVENTGELPSDEVVQVYAQFLDQGEEKQKLIAFKRLHDIAAHKVRAVELRIPMKDLMYYSETEAQFVMGNAYRIEVGASSRDIRLSEELYV